MKFEIDLKVLAKCGGVSAVLYEYFINNSNENHQIKMSYNKLIKIFPMFTLSKVINGINNLIKYRYITKEEQMDKSEGYTANIYTICNENIDEVNDNKDVNTIK